MSMSIDVGREFCSSTALERIIDSPPFSNFFEKFSDTEVVGKAQLEFGVLLDQFDLCLKAS